MHNFEVSILSRFSSSIDGPTYIQNAVALGLEFNKKGVGVTSEIAADPAATIKPSGPRI